MGSEEQPAPDYTQKEIDLLVSPFSEEIATRIRSIITQYEGQIAAREFHNLLDMTCNSLQAIADVERKEGYQSSLQTEEIWNNAINLLEPILPAMAQANATDKKCA